MINVVTLAHVFTFQGTRDYLYTLKKKPLSLVYPQLPVALYYVTERWKNNQIFMNVHHFYINLNSIEQKIFFTPSIHLIIIFLKSLQSF